MSEHAVDVTEATFADEIEQAELPVLVDFWAPWCGPCKQLAPRFDELAQMYQGRVKFAKIDIDGNKALAERFGVRSVPALLLLKAGEVVAQTLGAQSRSALVDLLDPHVTAQTSGNSPDPVKSLRAFHGDGGLKRKVIDQVRKHIEAGQVQVRGPFPPTGPICEVEKGQYTLIGAVLHGTSMEQYEATLGIPASAAILEDFIHAFPMQVSADALGSLSYTLQGAMHDYPLEWFEAIPPGADLRYITSHFLHGLLLDLAEGSPPLPFGARSSDSIRAPVRDVAMLHGRMAKGDAPSAAEWKAARETAGKASPSYQEDAVSWGVATCAEATSWPSDELPFVAREGLNALFSSLRETAVRHGYSAEAWAEREAIAATYQKKKESEPHAGRDAIFAWEETKAFFAMLKDARPTDTAQLELLQHTLGKYWHQGLMQALAKTLQQEA
ncbi:thioredoxin [Rhodanobacter glycinis]|uniref:Thioredoxin n=1 Tax=Rhodanobacter glycinis TaxID=582702 RepID=A0A1I4CUE1_9GAMM|nr:thioredoxin [Rhodanobacter glycinis]SFK84383.1 thioredoxin [Rhodanobacter glycinis]